MKELLIVLRRFIRGADMLLLILGIAAAAFGTVLIASASQSYPGGYASNVRSQLVALGLGVVLFILLSCIEPEMLGRLWKWLIGFNVAVIALLYLFGEEHFGNKSWLTIPIIDFSVQPAEILKLSFIVLFAAQLYRCRDNVSGLLPLIFYVVHFGAMFGLLVAVTKDIGVSLIYVAVFLCMLLGAGLKARWFLLGVLLLALSFPFIWSMLPDLHRNRILVAFDPLTDPEGLGYQALLSMKMVSGGGLTGQGLFQGMNTQRGVMPMRHNDFIFSVCGEELGFVGCSVLVVLLTIIILRCLYIGSRAKSGMGSLICIGVAGMFIFQTFLNIFMCVGLAPVIGITLPFFSAGGTSLIASFAALGLVSGVRNHPKTTWLDN